VIITILPDFNVTDLVAIMAPPSGLPVTFQVPGERPVSGHGAPSVVHFFIVVAVTVPMTVFPSSSTRFTFRLPVLKNRIAVPLPLTSNVVVTSLPVKNTASFGPPVKLPENDLADTVQYPGERSLKEHIPVDVVRLFTTEPLLTVTVPLIANPLQYFRTTFKLPVFLAAVKVPVRKMKLKTKK
jgi:hypothetical protein